jgi:hypothetical protein
MRTFLFLVLFVGAMTTVQTANSQCSALPNVDVGVHGGFVNFTIFDGRPAKKIFDAMPKSSKLSPKESCYTGVEMKVKGGLVCEFYTDDDPACAHACYLEVSAKTGKVLGRDRNNMCERDP